MNINIGDIEKLVQCLKDNGLSELEYQEGDSKIVLKYESEVTDDYSVGYPYGRPMYSRQRSDLQDLRAITQIKSTADVAEAERANNKVKTKKNADQHNKKNVNDNKKKDENGEYIRAPFGGLFYRQSKPGAVPYVQIGSSVKSGEVIGLIEAMKMITELTAPCDGVVTEIIAENEQYVEYDTPLFYIKAE